jgi:hypothetical protein
MQPPRGSGSSGTRSSGTGLRPGVHAPTLAAGAGVEDAVAAVKAFSGPYPYVVRNGLNTKATLEGAWAGQQLRVAVTCTEPHHAALVALLAWELLPELSTTECSADAKKKRHFTNPANKLQLGAALALYQPTLDIVLERIEHLLSAGWREQLGVMRAHGVQPLASPAATSFSVKLLEAVRVRAALLGMPAGCCRRCWPGRRPGWLAGWLAWLAGWLAGWRRVITAPLASSCSR